MKKVLNLLIGRKTFFVVTAVLLTFIMAATVAATTYAPMMEGKNGYTVSGLFTIGESISDYMPVGIPDGTAAYELDESTVRILVNHELSEVQGYAYQLANGTELTGARVSYFDVDKSSKEIKDAGLAYGTAYDRRGNIVTDANQINEQADDSTDGFSRFCSAQGYAAGQYSFEDNIYFTNEETSFAYGHPHGGSVWALNVDSGELWAVPALGRGTWENLTAVDTGSEDHVAILLGDDFQGAPLYLYVGQKNAIGDGSFLDRNGLAVGNVFVWRSVKRDTSPEDFNGTGSFRKGVFVPIKVQNPKMAGQEGYDEYGYLNDVTLRAEAIARGAFAFSRPEDLHTNPADGSQVVMASTGRGSLFPADNWGTTYQIDIDIRLDAKRGAGYGSHAKLTILHDADDYGDFGIRSADNLTWAGNGWIYIQEDRSTSPGSLFGAESGREASIWKLSPETFEYIQVAEMDRSAVGPDGSTDSSPDDIGNWESSGILDVTNFFDTEDGETLLLGTVQAHGISDGTIADENLAQGGQLIFISDK